jgi:hypothetical protein
MRSKVSSSKGSRSALATRKSICVACGEDAGTAFDVKNLFAGPYELHFGDERVALLREGNKGPHRSKHIDPTLSSRELQPGQHRMIAPARQTSFGPAPVS